MTKAEYDNLRVLPERKRATTNGKRMVKAFDKSCRDRIAIEHPDWLGIYDIDLATKLMVMYFFFTKYITASFDTKPYTVYTACFHHDGDGMYTDNLLDDFDNILNVRYKIKGMFLDLHGKGKK